VSGLFEAAIEVAVEAALTRWRAAAPGTTGVRAIAVGWTTVELARAEASIREAAADAVGPFGDAPGDEVIGAHVRAATILWAAIPTLRTIAVLEPSTEGLLAASLARLGEGPAVVWLARDATAGVSTDVAAGASPRTGPFGPEWLLPGSERGGRPVLVVDDAPGTIGI
jgi:hypothetical protein